MDITLCANLDCPARESCKRGQVSDSKYQSYAHFEFTWDDDNQTVECEHFEEVE